jgi:hypothetical protein
MLDYRAHKLFWLLTLPIRWAGKLASFVGIGIAILIAQNTSYSFWVKVIIAYASMEGLMLLVLFLWMLIMWGVKTVFFWFVDVIPSRGENEEEAREIVEKGKVIWLAKKLATEVENWTYDDTAAFVSVMNWRARWLFDVRNNFTQRLRLLVEYHEDTGREPGTLTTDEMKDLLGHLEPGWFEKTIVNNYYFNSLVGIVIIVVTLNAWRT